jgi:uncharacterized membrane protein
VDWTVVVASAAASGVEFLETAAIAYAMAHSGSRREAVWGTAAGLAVIVLVAVAAGPALVRIPLVPFRFVVGVLLLLLGSSWLLKSARRRALARRAGWIEEPLRDVPAHEAKIGAKWDFVALFAMAKSAGLETLEAVVLVIPLGAAHHAWAEVGLGAALAVAGTVLLLVAVHGHLRRLPEVTVKMAAGILLSSFGVFWIGEAAGLEWPLGEFAVIGLAAAWTSVAFGLVALIRARALKRVVE